MSTFSFWKKTNLLEILKNSLFNQLKLLLGNEKVNSFPYGRIISNQFGKFVYIHRTITINTHGKHINDLLYLSKDSVSLLSTCKKFDNLNIKNILFLDIETLSLQPITPIILIGMIFYRGRKFHLEQFFLLNHKDELSILYALKKRLKYFSYIVGYNVKAFDVNFIKSRCSAIRINVSFDDKDYIDMLVASRRFFRDRTPSYSLPSITELVFNEYRNDIPSSKIPEYWNKFLKTGKSDYAVKIIEHNRMDLVYTLKLFLWFFSRMKRPFGCYFENHDDRQSVLNLLKKYGKSSYIKEYIYYSSQKTRLK